MLRHCPQLFGIGSRCPQQSSIHDRFLCWWYLYLVLESNPAFGTARFIPVIVIIYLISPFEKKQEILVKNYELQNRVISLIIFHVGTCSR